MWKHYSWKTAHYLRKPTEKCLVKQADSATVGQARTTGEVWTDTVVPQQPPYMTVCYSRFDCCQTTTLTPSQVKKSFLKLNIKRF